MRQTIESRTVDDPADLWTTAPHSKVVRTLDFHVHPHQLRHTYITRLFESGLDIKEIQYLAGHATVNMTLRVYTHYQHESRQQSTAQKVCAAFGRKQVPRRCHIESVPLSYFRRKRRFKDVKIMF